MNAERMLADRHRARHGKGFQADFRHAVVVTVGDIEITPIAAYRQARRYIAHRDAAGHRLGFDIHHGDSAIKHIRRKGVLTVRA